MRPPIGTSSLLIFVLLSGLADGARAQILIEEYERLADDRPEAWAMNHASASTLMTAFGDPAALAPGQWRFAADFADVPHLDAEQRTVGFNGNKEEDLNKSPVAGRLRIAVGLPAGWNGEFGLVPPLEIDGARADTLLSLALAHRLWRGATTSLSARGFAQHGGIRGDITCPARLAGIDDFDVNPYGCQAPSRDRVALNHYGIELVGAWTTGAWQWHADLGLMRSEAETQVDALVYDARDRTRLVMRDTLPFVALGGRRRLAAGWSLAAELLHMPMSRRVGPGHPHEHGPGEEHDDDRPSRNDAFTGLRVQIAWDR
jgi:hypothetical protein